ncbi:MAG: hypothetical protein IJD32_05740 [Bacteroidaceae bacterium]|nr:hypothetical protein [Bacteroidaceae bacterium]
MEEHYRSGAEAVTNGIRQATDGLKTTIRNQIKSAGLGNRLANTWRGDTYPKSKKSISAAGVVYTKAPKIMEGFEFASVIRSPNGFWLAVPTTAIKKRAYGKRMTPALYERSKGVRLRFVYRSRGASFLVHEQRKKTIITFILVPQVKMPKIINFETESKKWQEKVPSLIVQNWSEDD